MRRSGDLLNSICCNLSVVLGWSIVIAYGKINVSPFFGSTSHSLLVSNFAIIWRPISSFGAKTSLLFKKMLRAIGHKFVWD